MNPPRGPTLAALAIAAAVAAVFVSRNADASGDDPVPDDTLQPPPMPPAEPVLQSPFDSLGAFLYMIRHTEHTRAKADSGAAYQTYFGNTQFYDLSDHPVNTGEKKPVRLSDAMCRAAGFSPGCVSTAAGAYQFIKPTWNHVRAGGAWGSRLPDFSPASQDEAARRALLESGALTLIEAGDIRGAIAKASKLWASLPGSIAGQPMYSFNDALRRTKRR